jgi:hypothetical protein
VIREILVPVIEGIAKAISTSREALAAELEEIAKGVRDGKLIANEAFTRAKHSVDRIREVKEGLPDE